MDRITDTLKDVLQNLSGKTLTGDYVTLDDLFKAFNKQYVCAVSFATTPENATIVLKKDDVTISADQDGKYYLKEGSYKYTASAEGYVTKENQSLTITNSDEATGTKTVSVTLSEV